MVACGVIAGCSFGAGEGEESEDLGVADVALTQVPAGIQCIRVVATGSSTVTTNLPVVASTSTATLSIGKLPLGQVSFSASAFEQACASVGSNSPSWLADPATATLQAGVPATVSLTFRSNNPVTVSANFVQSAVGIVPGRFAFGVNALLMPDNTLRTTGFPNNLMSSSTFANPGLTDVQAAAIGAKHLCFIKKSNGTVWCAGTNDKGQLGPNAPVGPMSWVTTPIQVPMPFSDRVGTIVAGASFTCVQPDAAVFNLSHVFCWGDNGRGQLGANSMAALSTTPLEVVFQANGALALGNEFGCATDGTGNAICWGANANGQLGNGNTTDSRVPVFVPGASATVSLAVGSTHSCALSATGVVRCWGSNFTGELGDGTRNQALTPVNVSGLGAGSNVAQLAAGSSYTCARFNNGNVSCWGSNAYGALGLGDTVERLVPTAVTAIKNAFQIAISDLSTLVLHNDRTVSTWGNNGNFQLGDGTRITRFLPVAAQMQ